MGVSDRGRRGIRDAALHLRGVSRSAQAVGAAAVALFALVLIIIATRSGRTTDLTDREVPTYHPPTKPPQSNAPPQHSGNGFPRNDAGPAPTWLEAIFWAIAIGIALVILGYIGRFLLGIIRETHLGGDDKEKKDRGSPEMAAETVAKRLTEVVDEVLATIERGETREAIIACWMRLEDVAAGVGVARRPAETAADFTERVLATYQVTAPALSELADLYREARFSAHTMGDAQRAAARTALETVRDDLVARRAAAAQEAQDADEAHGESAGGPPGGAVKPDAVGAGGQRGEDR
jgi:hypothetical protein